MTAWNQMKAEPVDIAAMIDEVQRLYAERRFPLLIERIETLLDLLPSEPALHNIAGAAYAGLGDLKLALACYDRAVALNPGFVDALSNRGTALMAMGRASEALSSFDGALRCQPGFAQAHANRAIALKMLGRPEDALAALTEALALAPGFAEAHYNRANILRDLRRFGEAATSYAAALACRPDHAEAGNNLGNLLHEMGRLDDAVAAYDIAIAAKPGFAEPHLNRGNVLHELKRMDEAAASYVEAVRLEPSLTEARARLFFLRAHMCDWSDPLSDTDLAGLDAAPPFGMLALDGDPARHLLRSKRWAEAKLPSAHRRWTRPIAPDGPIRIGYFSADFHMHATMFLMAGMFALHDRSRFQIHAFSYGPDRQDVMRQRAIDGVDRFHDVRSMDDAAIVSLSRAEGIDIAIDLKGYTQQARLEPFAQGLAPIQMTYLGYPGSVGADFIDYVVADEVVVPEWARRHYSEKLLAMPHSYQVNDGQRAIAANDPGRAAWGLPLEGFVFCCFNNSFKISSREFDVWMRLLRKVEGSVLWLLRDNAAVRSNLCMEAERRGVAAERLVFADRVPTAEHLARQRNADLFLDSFHYNAHTTASDALWAGLPVITKLGQAFAARVAGSLLHAVGLPELVTETIEDYEALALALAGDPVRLASIRSRLSANRSVAPLFDTGRFVRDFERGLEMVLARQSAGLPPDHIVVPPR